MHALHIGFAVSMQSIKHIPIARKPESSIKMDRCVDLPQQRDMYAQSRVWRNNGQSLKRTRSVFIYTQDQKGIWGKGHIQSEESGGKGNGR